MAQPRRIETAAAARGGVGGPGAAERSALGGKAWHLRTLSAAGLSVPDWLCVTTAVFDSVWESVGKEVCRLLESAAAPDRTAAAIRDAFLRAEFPARDEEELLRLFDARFGADARVAVRSSGVEEDRPGQSFAGQLDSFLFVPRAELVPRVLECFASGYTGRARAYRAARGQATERVRVAVVVQAMVDSRASGVMFTADPVGGSRGASVIAAGYGLGEGVVANRVPADTYVVDRESRAVRERQIADKAERVAPRESEGGTHVVSVEAELRSAPALTDAEIRTLVDLGGTVETVLGAAQDIEWALDREGAFWLLQSRPIALRPAERLRVFDNGNIGENYPGVSTPLTCSHARLYYEEIWKTLALEMGLPARVWTHDRNRFSSLIGVARGRIYYSLADWYRLFFLIPAAEKAIPALEMGLGVQEPLRDPEEVRAELRTRLSSLERIRLYLGVARVVSSVGRRIDGMLRALEEVETEFREQPLERLSADQLLAAYELLLERLVPHWSASIANDYCTVVWYALLGRALAAWAGDESGSLCRDLVSGAGRAASVEPVRSLLALASRASADDALRRLFDADLDDGDVWEAIESRPELRDFRDAALEHLRRYGARQVDELKMETPDLEANPAALVAMLKGPVLRPGSMEKLEARERSTRSAAERAVEERLRRRPLRRWLVRRLVPRVRTALLRRESGRLARTRRYAIERRIFLEMGRAFAREGVLAEPEDILYLEIEEIERFLRGTRAGGSLRAEVAARRAEYAEYAREDLPQRLEFRGGVGPVPAPTAAEPAGEGGGPRRRLEGRGCSPGRARGRARVVHDPARTVLSDGEILVARTTDPGWVFLMTSAEALAVERGNVLSHTAIVARELGIPMVIGVEGLLDRVRDGDEIEVDGSVGTLAILERQPAAEESRPA